MGSAAQRVRKSVRVQLNEEHEMRIEPHKRLRTANVRVRAAPHAVDLLGLAGEVERLEKHTDALQEGPVPEVEQRAERRPQLGLELASALAL